MNIERAHAKELIGKESISSIGDEEALQILASYWHYDCELAVAEDIKSGVLPRISDELILLIINTEEPPVKRKNIFVPLFLDWKIFELKYATNEYLEDRLKSYGRNFKVKGMIEKAGICPCCRFYSIGPGEDGLWDICPVCFWENGGDGPNHISIAEAQKNFRSIGAIDKRSLQFVEKDGTIKYAKSA